MKSIQITKDGLEKLQEELKELIGKKPLIIDKVQKARSMGDLSENNAYHAAREELSLLEGRIGEIETILKYAVIVESSSDCSVVSVGKQVTVQVGEETKTFRIVGEYEADPMKGFISITSPIGKAINGKKPGDTVLVNTPKGNVSYTIVSIT